MYTPPPIGGLHPHAQCNHVCYHSHHLCDSRELSDWRGDNHTRRPQAIYASRWAHILCICKARRAFSILIIYGAFPHVQRYYTLMHASLVFNLVSSLVDCRPHMRDFSSGTLLSKFSGWSNVWPLVWGVVLVRWTVGESKADPFASCQPIYWQCVVNVCYSWHSQYLNNS